MEPRLDYKSYPAMQAMLGMEKKVHQLGLDPKIVELIKLRASQINGCAFCVDMHTKDARAHGETEQRLYAVSVWKETPFFTDRERAALEWTEALTLIADNEIPDDFYQRVRKHFSDEELVNLTLAVVTINGWNRFAKTFRTVPGTYQPAAQ